MTPLPTSKSIVVGVPLKSDAALFSLTREAFEAGPKMSSERGWPAATTCYLWRGHVEQQFAHVPSPKLLAIHSFYLWGKSESQIKMRFSSLIPKIQFNINKIALKTAPKTALKPNFKMDDFQCNFVRFVTVMTVCVVNKMYPYLGYISCVRASIASLLDA